MSGKISLVAPDSIAAELGIEAGDMLIKINGQPVSDLIDYNFLCNDSFLELEIRKLNGEIWMCELDKDIDEDLGISFVSNVFDGVRRCVNHCLFCFVDQLPPNVRSSLLLKDDDYRMSFLEGNYITCTNMTEDDFQRISRMHLSPLFISVHSVDPLLRRQILCTQQNVEIMLTLQRLIAYGCSLHTQIVLCPDINDGVHLQRTLDALGSLRALRKNCAGVASVAVVPVGLTGYQRKTYLRAFTQQEAAAVIDEIERRQREHMAKPIKKGSVTVPCGDPFVYAADEFYLLAGRAIPGTEMYGDYPQLENGVGLLALFAQQWRDVQSSVPSTPVRKKTGVVTGRSGAAALRPVIDEINRVSNSDIDLIVADNIFFGSRITVTGLLTGRCITHAVEPGVYDRLIIPSVMLKYDEDIFLDNMTVDKLADVLQTKIMIIKADPQSLLEALFDQPTAKEENI